MVRRTSGDGVVLRGGPIFASGDGTPRGDAAWTGRIPGLDLARGLAILGMLAAHTVSSPDREYVFDGRSAVLFAVLAGVSIALMTGGSTALPRERHGRSRLSIALRGIILIVLGLGLWLLETPIAIILDTYGFLFLVVVPLLYWPRWALGAAALAAAVAGPAVAGVISDWAEDTGGISDGPASIPVSWLASYYPAPVWLAYLLVGLVLGRSDVTRLRTQLVAMVGGGISAVAGYAIPAVLGTPVAAHDDSTFEVFGAGGVALVVVGALSCLGTRAAPRLRSMLRAARPLAAAGSMPLTIYTGQVLAIALVPLIPGLTGSGPMAATGGVAAGGSLALFVALALASVLFATLWLRRVPQGPLEWLVARLSLRRPWRRRRAAQPVG